MFRIQVFPFIIYNAFVLLKYPCNCQDCLCVPHSGMPFFNVQCIYVTKISLIAKITYFFIAPHLFFLAPHLIWKIGVAPRKIGVAPENFSRAPCAAPHLKKSSAHLWQAGLLEIIFNTFSFCLDMGIICCHYFYRGFVKYWFFILNIFGPLNWSKDICFNPPPQTLPSMHLTPL